MCVFCREVTGSVIGPRGFYLAAMTGHVGASPHGLIGHLELITNTSIMFQLSCKRGEENTVFLFSFMPDIC